MTYRGNGYLKFSDAIKTKSSIDLKLANKEMDEAIIRDKKKSLLQDHSAVESNQNVFDSLSE